MLPVRPAGWPAERHRAAAVREEEVKDLRTELSRPSTSHDKRLNCSLLQQFQIKKQQEAKRVEHPDIFGGNFWKPNDLFVSRRQV